MSMKRRRDYAPAAVVSAMYQAKRRRTALADASRARHFYRVGLRRGPFRTGGFYGASVRSPAERKVVDVAHAGYSVSSTGSVTLINGIATGTDFTNRIGRRVNIVAIQARGWMYPDQLASSIPTAGRFLIVQDMQVNGVIATPSDIFNQLTPSSFMNMNNRERFKVLVDKQFVFGPRDITATTAVAGTPAIQNINIYKKCNIPVVFEGTDATIASISSNALYIVFLGNIAAGNGDLTCVMSTRCRFIDA